jgi:hypothetical protein
VGTFILGDGKLIYTQLYENSICTCDDDDDIMQQLNRKQQVKAFLQ